MSLQSTICSLNRGLSSIGAWLSLLGLRLLLAWEFFWPGIGKLQQGVSSFTDYDFPFPFNVLPVAVNWFLATWVEILGALGLALGLGTRFWAAGLIILDAVAWASVHADNGYNVCGNGYKLPLIFMVMLVPLLLSGAGKFRIDHIIAGRDRR